MPRIEIETWINASAMLCFDLSRDIDLHVRSTHGTDEVAVAGVTSGLIGLGESVTWEATHFGIRQRLTSRITAFQPPAHFRDSLVEGIFKRFDHDHFFTPKNSGTTMRDVFDYESPLGILGRIADRLFVAAYMKRLLATRAAVIKSEAELRARVAAL